mmetsp:Transcript_10840/g.16460  ORF Transcript_10840/g.16460 Transcript_10840/m.16460 type:complete len:192 (-) Transcript_10840:698-1273(-)
MRVLKKEARRRQLTVVCTIHQPSSDLFLTFDRLLLLHEGKTVFHGKITDLASYMREYLQIPMGVFTNPADVLLKMTQAPALVREGLTHERLFSTFNTVQAWAIAQEIEEKEAIYAELETDFRKFSSTRSSGACKQFGLVFMRNAVYTVRDKLSFASIFLSSLLIGLLALTVFWKSLEFPDLQAMIDRQEFD